VYIASLCQTEADCDLSVAAQAQSPEKKNYIKLDVRLE
jgi:hypothetical protein